MRQTGDEIMTSADTIRLRREIEDVTERYRAAGYFPSACVRVFSRSETLAAVCVGEAKEDSLFDAASLTKIATGLQILRLVSNGALALDEEICDALPPLQDDGFLRARLKGVTLRRLLTHTSSLPAWYPFYTLQSRDFIAGLSFVLAHAEETQGTVYSDLNFMLLGKVLEWIQKKPLARCLREDLAQPLHLGNMTYLPDRRLPIVPSSYGNPIEESMCRERNLTFSSFRPADKPVRGEVNDGNAHYYFGGVSGHAGIFADAAAWERLCQFCMNNDDPLVLEAQREQPGAEERGLGFQTGLSYPHGCGHTGFTGTGIYFSTEYNIGVISLTNRLFYPKDNSNATWEFRRVLHEAAFALAGERPKN